MYRRYLAVGAILLVSAACAPAYAQRGRGEEVGVARQSTKPEIVTLDGVLKSIETGPCKQTTGRAGTGTHLILQTTKEETVNLHLGPAAVVDQYIQNLKVGDSVTARAFRMPTMSANEYVAVQLEFGESSVTLRSDSFRPIWAGRRAFGRRGPGPNSPYGRGHRNNALGPWWADESWSDLPPGRGHGRQFHGMGPGYGRGRGPGANR